MSTRLGNKDKEDILAELNRLLGRSWKMFPCPFEDVGMVRIYNGIHRVEELDMITALDNAGYNVRHCFADAAAVIWTSLKGDMYEIHMRLGREIRDLPKVDSRFLYKPDATNINLRHGEDSLRLSCGNDWGIFQEWVINQGSLYDEMKSAWDTVNEIVNMTSTAGQIRRMVPELLDYLPKDKAEALRAQKRASNVPYKWSAFDRNRVQRALHALAKCHIMPKVHGCITDLPNMCSKRVFVRQETGE